MSDYDRVLAIYRKRIIIVASNDALSRIYAAAILLHARVSGKKVFKQ